MTHNLDTLEALKGTMLESYSASIQEGNIPLINSAFCFIQDLENWHKVIQKNSESKLLDLSTIELNHGLLSLTIGQYRNAFKSLRLVLELQIQMIRLSANLVEREQWLNGTKDTNWGSLMDEESGPFSAEFMRAFSIEAEDSRKHYCSLCQTLYRELSETIHGNIPERILLKNSLQYCSETFTMWFEKMDTIRTISAFILVNRYLKELPVTSLDIIKEQTLEELGHMENIRDYFERNVL